MISVGGMATLFASLGEPVGVAMFTFLLAKIVGRSHNSVFASATAVVLRPTPAGPAKAEVTGQRKTVFHLLLAPLYPFFSP